MIFLRPPKDHEAFKHHPRAQRSVCTASRPLGEGYFSLRLCDDTSYSGSSSPGPKISSKSGGRRRGRWISGHVRVDRSHSKRRPIQ
jgi:hypothetical protein